MKLLTQAEAASRVRVSLRTFERIIAKPGSPALTRIGARKFIAECDLERWIEDQRQLGRHAGGTPEAKPSNEAALEKSATSLYDYVVVSGVRIESRWQKQDEIDGMVAVVRLMPPQLALEMRLLWCDSKEGCQYTCELRRGRSLRSREAAVAAALEHFLCERPAGGHNGVFVGRVTLDACWPHEIT